MTRSSISRSPTSSGWRTSQQTPGKRYLRAGVDTVIARGQALAFREIGDAMDATDTQDITATWVDKLAVQELVHRYADGVNRADWDQVRGVFAPHAVWEAPALGMHFGTAGEFCDFLAQTQTSSQLLVQTPHATVVRLTSSDAATATTTIHEMSLGRNLAEGALGGVGEELNMEDYGVYYDAAERISGEWLFVHRLFVPLYMDVGRVTGNVVTERDQLL